MRLIKTYKTKPKTIQAIRWTGTKSCFDEIQKFIKNTDFQIYYDHEYTYITNRLLLYSKNDVHITWIMLGDYVLKKEFNYITATNGAFLHRDYELVKNETI